MTLLLFFAALALGVSFLCSLLEASLLSIPRSHIESMAEQGHPRARALEKLKANIDQPLAAILTFNTVAHTVGAAGVGAQAAVIFGDAAVGIASALMTLAILVFSEIIPKTLGALHARSLAGVTVWLTRAMILSCYPVIWALEKINRMIGSQNHGDRLSRMEVIATIRLGGEGGSLARREQRTVLNVLALSEVAIKSILTPRTVLFALPASMTVAETLEKHRPIRYARIPVHTGDVDEITGYVSRFDIHKAAAEGRAGATLGELRQPLIVLPELGSVADALEQMMNRQQQIALVVDEAGGVEGIVTLEDVLETLLGQEIVDETDVVVDLQELARRRAQRRGGA